MCNNAHRHPHCTAPLWKTLPSVHTLIQVDGGMHKHTLSYTRSHRQLSRHVIKLESTRVSRWQRLPLGIEGWSSWSTPWVGDRERGGGGVGSRANQTSKCDNNFVSTASKRQTDSLGQSKPQHNMYQRADESQSLLSTAKVQMHTQGVYVSVFTLVKIRR